MTRRPLLLTLSAVLAGAADAKDAGRTRDIDPYEAYARGDYQTSLDEFLNRQVEHPDDARLGLNVGAAQYQLGRHGDAERSFAAAQNHEDPTVRSQALYDLGNAAFRRGRLAQAVDAYRAALEMTPTDADAKHNLELAQQKMQQMREQDEQRQQQPSETPQGDDQPPPQPSQERPADQQPPAQQNPEQSQDAQGQQPRPDGADKATSPADASAQPEPQTPTMSQAEAERALRALDEQRPERRARSRGPAQAQDW